MISPNSSMRLVMSTLDIQRFLDQRHIEYSLISHPRTFTARATAQSAHIPWHELAKTVVVRIDGIPAMVVQAADEQVSFRRLKNATGAATVQLAKENEIGRMFPDCELGAMPPFGSFYNMDVYVSEALTEDEEIAFNAGSHTELIKLAYRDFEELEHPNVVAV